MVEAAGRESKCGLPAFAGFRSSAHVTDNIVRLAAYPKSSNT
jgi:hypothetical protein